MHWFAGEGNQTQPPGASLALATASSNLGYYFEVAPIHVQNYSAVLNSVITDADHESVIIWRQLFQSDFSRREQYFQYKSLGLYLSPSATKNGEPIMGAPNIAIAGFDQVGITPPEGRNDITGHLTDILSYLKGKHQLRFGGEFRQGRDRRILFPAFHGSLHVRRNPGTLGTLLLGSPIGYGLRYQYDGTGRLPCGRREHILDRGG